jgi:nanoRNase/pAp phosphatase (c-di-AMP/oligoRNAs hydrolase)
VRCVAITQSRATIELLRTLFESGRDELLFLVEELRLQRYAQRRGCSAARVNLRQRSAFEALALGAEDVVVVHLRDERRLTRLLRLLTPARGAAPVIVLHSAPLETARVDRAAHPHVQFLSLGEHFGPIFATQLRLARARPKLAELRAIGDRPKSLLILIQDDPDPDAIASAVALRRLLDRNRKSAPIATFGEVTRPENLAMLKLLDIPLIERLAPADLASYEGLALVDVQPARFQHELPPVDIVIDHHPEAGNGAVAFRDIRPSYGATATILTEYLRARDAGIPARIATALLYGIRTDTLTLDRDVAAADVEAFTYLYPLANTNLVRRMERPEIPLAVLETFSRGLEAPRIVDRVVFSDLGRVEREDVIPYLADFCLQIEGVEWSVVSGIHEQSCVIAVRNVGFVRAAGEVVREAWGELGSAGGHRSMAKAVLPLARVPRGSEPGAVDLERMQAMFLQALRRSEPTK